MAVQKALGSDIVMIFDECTPYPATESQASESMELSREYKRAETDEEKDRIAKEIKELSTRTNSATREIVAIIESLGADELREVTG